MAKLNDDMMLETTIAKTKTFQFRLGDMPQEAIEKMLRYGAQRVFNDRVGSMEKYPTTESKVAEVEAMLARFKAGQIGRVVGTGVDAITKLARQLVRAALKASNPDGAKRLAAKEKDEQAATLDALIAKNPQFVETAKKMLAKRAAPVAIDTGDVEL